MINNKKNQGRKISFAEIREKLNDSLVNTDGQRLQRLQGLSRVRKAKLNLQKRESQRLRTKFDSKNQRVVEVDAKRERNQLVIENLELDIERHKIDLSAFDKDSWNLFGYVRDRKLKGISNLTVSLYDEQGKWIKQLGYACTNERGQFSLIIKPIDADGDGISDERKLFIYVSDKMQVIHRDKKPINLAERRFFYREILILKKMGDCAPPPTPTVKDKPTIKKKRTTGKTGKKKS